MLRTIWDHDIPGSVREAFDYLDRKDDSFGVYNFNEIMLLKNKFPSIFQPVYALQTSIIHNTLGEYWWDMHKVTSYEAKQEEAERAAAIMLKEQRDKERADEMLNEAMIKRRMGIRYYLMPWERAKEMRKLQRIAAIEREFNPG